MRRLLPLLLLSAASAWDWESAWDSFSSTVTSTTVSAFEAVKSTNWTAVGEQASSVASSVVQSTEEAFDGIRATNWTELGEGVEKTFESAIKSGEEAVEKLQSTNWSAVQQDVLAKGSSGVEATSSAVQSLFEGFEQPSSVVTPKLPADSVRTPTGLLTVVVLAAGFLVVIAVNAVTKKNSTTLL
ncbi:MAG: hypothetical protein SGPRY_012109 [Prymnesium sp.]